MPWVVQGLVWPYLSIPRSFHEWGPHERSRHNTATKLLAIVRLSFSMIFTKPQYFLYFWHGICIPAQGLGLGLLVPDVLGPGPQGPAPRAQVSPTRRDGVERIGRSEGCEARSICVLKTNTRGFRYSLINPSWRGVMKESLPHYQQSFAANAISTESP